MRNNKRLLIGGVSLLSVGVMVLGTFVATRTPAHANVQVGKTVTIGKVTKGVIGKKGAFGHTTVNIGSIAASPSYSKNPTVMNSKSEYKRGDADSKLTAKHANGKASQYSTLSGSGIPGPTPQTVTTHNFSFTGQNGVSHVDQRTAGSGAYANTQYSLVPPDQMLCSGVGIGGTYVLEGGNNAFRVYKQYSNSITPLTGPIAFSQFYGFAPEINRVTGVTGPFISDPKCAFDPDNGGHWFISELAENNGSDPNADGRFYNVLAVSATSDPRSSYTLFTYDVTDDGANGTPYHAGCPCLGDQPLIGFDKWGFYQSTNEFPAYTAGFNGAQVYELNKGALEQYAQYGESSLPLNIVHINASDLLANAGGQAYSLQPAVSAIGDYNKTNIANQTAQNGIEYFLSSLDFYGTYDNRIAAWALTNTRSINFANPAPNLQVSVLGSEAYASPSYDGVMQKAGNIHPLMDSLAALGDEEPTERLNANDDRMNQVAFSQNILYGAVNTAISATDPDGVNYTGAAWFMVLPSFNHGAWAPHLTRQGYVSVANESTFFPAIAVDKNGNGVMALSMSGPNTFPSAVYIRMSATAGTYGHVHLASLGKMQDDSFGGYYAYGGNGVDRWGDYGGAYDDGAGHIIVASEWTPSLQDPTANPPYLANWGTFISRVGTDTNL